MKINFLKFTKVKNTKCDLIFFNKIKSNIKNFERVFFLIAKEKCIRGNHAHKKCSQFFISLKDTIKMELDEIQPSMLKLDSLNKTWDIDRDVVVHAITTEIPSQPVDPFKEIQKPPNLINHEIQSSVH